MSKIMNEIYYILEEQVGQELLKDEKAKRIAGKKGAAQDEVIHRLGEGGCELLEVISNLNLELEDIHDKALFRAAVRLGVELARPEAGGKG